MKVIYFPASVVNAVLSISSNNHLLNFNHTIFIVEAAL